MRDLVEQIEYADQTGLDVFGIGEHYRAEFQMNAASLPHAKMMRAIEKIGERVVPALPEDFPATVSQR